MASLLFPDTGTRMVLLPYSVPAAGRIGTLYAAKTGTTLAEVYVHNGTSTPGALIANAQITLDQYGQQPDYWGPAAGTDFLYLEVNGIRSRVNADYDARLDATDAAAQTKADAALAAAKVHANTKAQDAVDGLIPFAVPLISTPLAASAVFTSAPLSGYRLGHPTQRRAVIRLTVTADVTYTVTVDSSLDGAAWALQATYTPTLVAALWTVDVTLDPANRYIRFTVTAGAAQSSLNARAVFS